MANIKISAMSPESSMTGTESVPIVKSGSNKKANSRDIAKIGYQDVVTNPAITRTLAISDIGAWLRFTAGSETTVTVPTNTAVPFAVGTTLNGVQAGLGQVAISPAAGVTINKPSGVGYKTRGQGSSWCLIKVAQDTWDLIGDMETLP